MGQIVRMLHNQKTNHAPTSMPIPHIYEPSGTESESSSEHSTSSSDSKTDFQICHGGLKHDQSTFCNK